MRRRRRPPTDFELLKAIYARYKSAFPEFVRGAKNSRDTKILVPIDIPAIARQLRVDEDSVFGRLYYHLDPMYGEPQKVGGPRKVFFTPVSGSDRNCVNFPLLEAVFAGLWQQRRRDRSTFWIAVVSIAVALGSLLVSIVALTT